MEIAGIIIISLILLFGLSKVKQDVEQKYTDNPNLGWAIRYSVMIGCQYGSGFFQTYGEAVKHFNHRVCDPRITDIVKISKEMHSKVQKYKYD